MSAPVKITDHAMLRYLERVVGFDFSGFRDTLERRLQPAIDAGAGVAKIDDTTFIISDNRVVTVLPEGGRPKKADRHAKRWP